MEFHIVTPKSKSDLLKAIKQHKNNFRFGAGYTDLILELKRKGHEEGLTIINLAQLEDRSFTSIEKSATTLRIGSLVTAYKIVNDKFIRDQFPVLYEAANNLASMQIRQVATVGGNLCTASPSGDVSCALVALNAVCEILSAEGKVRTLPVTQFFLGPRKTALKKDEILRTILIPLNGKGVEVRSGFIKVGTRRSMECSVVSFAYHLQMDKKNVIKNAGVAIGAVAPVIRFAADACKYLIGKDYTLLCEEDRGIFVGKVLQYASPISDLRATAWYRKEVLGNVSRSMIEN